MRRYPPSHTHPRYDGGWKALSSEHLLARIGVKRVQLSWNVLCIHKSGRRALCIYTNGCATWRPLVLCSVKDVNWHKEGLVDWYYVTERLTFFAKLKWWILYVWISWLLLLLALDASNTRRHNKTTTMNTRRSINGKVDKTNQTKEGFLVPLVYLPHIKCIFNGI